MPAPRPRAEMSPHRSGSAHSTLRYRAEASGVCIDVGARSIDRLLDHRDPAPFRDRDLDPGLVDYLLGAAEDLAREPRLHVIFWITEPCSGNEVRQAYRAHFEDLLRRIQRRNQLRRRFGASALLLGLVLLLGLFGLAQLAESTFGGSTGRALSEGITILSWIALWRPIEVLLFDWIPLRQERILADRLLAAPVDVRSGAPPVIPGAENQTAAGA